MKNLFLKSGKCEIYYIFMRTLSTNPTIMIRIPFLDGSLKMIAQADSKRYIRDKSDSYW